MSKHTNKQNIAHQFRGLSGVGSDFSLDFSSRVGLGVAGSTLGSGVGSTMCSGVVLGNCLGVGSSVGYRVWLGVGSGIIWSVSLGVGSGVISGVCSRAGSGEKANEAN